VIITWKECKIGAVGVKSEMDLMSMGVLVLDKPLFNAIFGFRV
jgi:hypothetical protein